MKLLIAFVILFHAARIEPSYSQDNPIRKVDFRNFTYDYYPDWGEVPVRGKKMILRDGEMEVDVPWGVNAPVGFYLLEVNYGDVTGDKVEDAVIVLGIRNRGTARPHAIFVYELSHGHPRMLWVYGTGDRAYWGYKRAYTQNGQLLVERYKPDTMILKDKKMEVNSSSYYIRDYYKWRRDKFHRIKTEIIPNEAESGKPYVHKPSRFKGRI